MVVSLGSSNSSNSNSSREQKVRLTGGEGWLKYRDAPSGHPHWGRLIHITHNNTRYLVKQAGLQTLFSEILPYDTSIA